MVGVAPVKEPLVRSKSRETRTMTIKAAAVMSAQTGTRASVPRPLGPGQAGCDSCAMVSGAKERREEAVPWAGASGGELGGERTEVLDEVEGEGAADWKWILPTLKEAGYNGFLILEPHNRPQVVSTMRAVMVLRQRLAEAGVEW